MKRIFSLIIAAMCVIAAYSQGAGWKYSGSTAWPGVVRDWNTATYDQFYLVSHYDDMFNRFSDGSWRTFSNQWESGDYEFTKTCEYYTNYVPVVGTEATLFPDPFIHDGVCLANTLVDVKIPVSDNFVIPSMPDINLFFVDLDFIIRQKNHLNSLTIPNMIRGVYSSSGDKLYVDTLYVEGDYECMVNNKLKGNSVLGNNWESEFIYNKIGYCDDWSPVEYAIEGKEPVLIAKTVIYEGEPIKSYTKRGKGVGFGNEETYLNYLMANQWGDQIESVELTDRSLRGIASNAFSGSKTLKRVKITFPEWSGEFEYEPIGTFLPVLRTSLD